MSWKRKLCRSNIRSLVPVLFPLTNIEDHGIMALLPCLSLDVVDLNYARIFSHSPPIDPRGFGCGGWYS